MKDGKVEAMKRRLAVVMTFLAVRLRLLGTEIWTIL